MRYLIFFIVLFFVHFPGFGQSYNHTFTGSGGISDKGYGGELTYNTNRSETAFTQLSLLVSVENFESGDLRIPYSSFVGSYSYFTTVLSRNRRMQSLSMGGGALAGYELANNGQNEISNIVSLNGESKFIYGGLLTLDLDIILSEHYSLVLKTSESFHANSDFGKFTNYTALGLRYYFN